MVRRASERRETRPATSVTFWGVRSSIASPGPGTLKFGGNTACIEVRAGDGTFVLECGTGCRELGRALLARAPLDLHLLFSDYRWDHIQGFPFFTPVYIPTSRITVYGPVRSGLGVRTMLDAQMRFPVFPIQLEHLNAKFTWVDVAAPRASYAAGAARVESIAAGDARGWRIDAADRRIVYLPEATRSLPLAERAEFCERASLVIYDGSVPAGLNGRHAQATRAAWDEAVALARAAKARRVAVFHHSPEDDDRALDSLQRRARKAFSGAVAASEGMTLRL